MSSIIQLIEEKLEGQNEADSGIDDMEFRAGEMLAHPGQFNLHGYAVKSGCLRSYVLDSRGKEHTIQFAPENWLIGDIEASANQQPTSMYIEAIEASQVYRINTRSFHEILQKDTASLLMSNKLLMNRVVALQKRLILQISASAEERYEEFMRMYPDLAQRVPLRYIASYLGITPESLSRVRKQLSIRVT